jgi:hypothetical protein
LISKESIPPETVSLTRSQEQRHILRDRQPSTPACPACWAMGTNDLK